MNPATANGATLNITLTRQFSNRIVDTSSVRVCENLSINATGVAPRRAYNVPRRNISVLAPRGAFDITSFATLTKRCVRSVATQKRLPLLMNNAKLCIRDLLCKIHFATRGTPSNLHRRLATRLRAVNPRTVCTGLRTISPRTTTTVRPGGGIQILQTLRRCRTANGHLDRRGTSSLPPRHPCHDLILKLSFPSHTTLCHHVSLQISGVLRTKLLTRTRCI